MRVRMHVYADVYAKCLCVKLMRCCYMCDEEIILNDYGDDELIEIIFF